VHELSWRVAWVWSLGKKQFRSWRVGGVASVWGKSHVVAARRIELPYTTILKQPPTPTHELYHRCQECLTFLRCRHIPVLGDAAARDGLWLWNELLATTARLAGAWYLAIAPLHFAGLVGSLLGPLVKTHFLARVFWQLAKYRVSLKTRQCHSDLAVGDARVGACSFAKAKMS
jgi:hypothetical protein